MIMFNMERYPEDQAKYQLEKAQLNESDIRLARLLSSIERERCVDENYEVIPIYEELAFALKDKVLRSALIEALMPGSASK